MLDALPNTVSEIAYWLATLAILASACIFADRPERLGASVVLANFVASALVQELAFEGIQIGILAADLAMVTGLYWIALRYRRWWTHAATAFALLTLTSHVAAIAEEPQRNWLWAYVTWQWLASGGVLLSLLASTGEAPFARKYEAWAARAIAN